MTPSSLKANVKRSINQTSLQITNVAYNCFFGHFCETLIISITTWPSLDQHIWQASDSLYGYCALAITTSISWKQNASLDRQFILLSKIKFFFSKKCCSLRIITFMNLSCLSLERHNQCLALISFSYLFENVLLKEKPLSLKKKTHRSIDILFICLNKKLPSNKIVVRSKKTTVMNVECISLDRHFCLKTKFEAIASYICVLTSRMSIAWSVFVPLHPQFDHSSAISVARSIYFPSSV
jgi:hypothetical protein